MRRRESRFLHLRHDPTEEDFRRLTLAYYRGRCDDSTIAEIRHRAQKYDLKVPAEDGFAMTTLVFICELIKYGDVEKIGKQNIEKGAVLVLLEIVDKNLKAFLSGVRGAL